MEKKNAFIAMLVGSMLLLAVGFEVQTLSYRQQFGQWAGSMGSLITSYISPLAEINYQSLVPGSIANVVNFFGDDTKKTAFLVLGGALLGAAGTSFLYKKYKEYLAREQEKAKRTALQLFGKQWKGKIQKFMDRIIGYLDDANIPDYERYEMIGLKWQDLTYPDPEANKLVFVEAINALLRKYFPLSGYKKIRQLKLNQQMGKFELK